VTAAAEPGPPIGEEVSRPKRKSELVTEQLLDAATVVFGERGFEAATVSEVARRCGMTSGAVYARWPNKRDLFLAAIEYTSAQRMLLLIKQAEAAADDKLGMLGANLLTSTRDETRNLWIEACVSASRDSSVHPTVAGCMELEAGDLTEIVEEGKASGVIDPALSTPAVVFLCQSLGLGTYLALRVQSPERPRLSGDDWSAVVERLIAAVGPRS
jgi:AcrR family transcriptional regulator